jgi:NitT/TauT family transport system substrate-binding protein
MRKNLANMLLVLTGLFALAGCPGNRSPRTVERPQGTALPTVTVGYFPNVTHAPAVLGFSASQEAFAKALDGKAALKTRIFNAGPAAMEALHATAVDLCFVGPAPAINAYARGGDLVLVANVANGGSVLVARKGSAIRSAKDLEGRRIAVPQLGNTQDVLLRHLLKGANIRLGDQGGTTVVLPVENPDVMGLFERAQLDAACVPEPWGSRLEIEAGATVVLDWKAIWRNGVYPVTVLVVRKEFLTQHRGVVAAFVTALRTVAQGLVADPKAHASALNAELKVLTGQELKPEVITRALHRLDFTALPNAQALKAMAEVMMEAGYAKTMPDLSGLIDTSLLGTTEASTAGAGSKLPLRLEGIDLEIDEGEFVCMVGPVERKLARRWGLVAE